MASGGAPTVRPAGKPYTQLLEDLTTSAALAALKLVDAAQLAPELAGGFNIEGLAEGRWRVTVRGDDGELAELSEVRDLVVRDRQSLEGIELGADPVNLARLAGAGGFRADSLDQAVPLIQDLAERLVPKATPRLTTHSLWDNYLALLAVLGLLAVEWMWRKRVGLP